MQRSLGILSVTAVVLLVATGCGTGASGAAPNTAAPGASAPTVSASSTGTAKPQPSASPSLCAEFPPAPALPGDVEGWWSSTPTDAGGNAITDPSVWPNALMREHPRVALVRTGTGAVISTWDRKVCGPDPSFRPAKTAAWPADAVVAIDMDTGAVLEVVH